MVSHPLVLAIFIVFATAALAATAALFSRQSLLVGYILMGVAVGPWGLGFIADAGMMNDVGEVGILFLLFLLGLQLNPEDLWHSLRKTSLITLVSTVIFGVTGYIIGHFFGLTPTENLVVGISMVFSSTIIGLKLLPNYSLQQRHHVELMVGVLLLQDLIAIAALLLIHATITGGGLTVSDGFIAILALPGLLVFSYLFNRFVLIKLMLYFDYAKEYLFLLALAWCLGMAELGSLLGLSEGIGAFVAGVSVAASSPLAMFIASSLQPLRDFFLVLFFFAIGAEFNLHYLPHILVPALVLAGVCVLIKPWVFSVLAYRAGESKANAWEFGVRLGQASEFSLLIAVLASNAVPSLISDQTHAMIEAMTVFSFIISCYWVVRRYPTPLQRVRLPKTT